MQNNIHMRLSYTAFNLWKRGNIPGLVDYMRGVEFIPTEQMLEGMKFDDEACKSALDTKQLPDCFGGFKLKAPRAQLYLSATLVTPKGRTFDFVGKPDVVDIADKALYELKTGVMSSLSYAQTLQVPTQVMLLLKAKNIKIERAYVCRHDQYFNTTDVSQILLSDRLISNTEAEVLEIADSIYDFLSETITESTPRWKIN
jgi:hypothetical protein